MTPMDAGPGPHVQAVGWTLLHSLWQQALVAGLLASLRSALTRRSAEVRYLAASLGLGLMVLAPLVTLAALELGARPAAVFPSRGAVSARSTADPEESAPAPARFGGRGGARERMTAILPDLVACWSAGVALFSLRFLGGWAGAGRLKRSGGAEGLEPWQRRVDELASELGLRRPVRVLRSLLVEVPTVVGWLRPAILLPLGTLVGLTPFQIETLLAHELAHIRRHDYLTNLFQVAAETLFFYHPAVWWASSRMRVEREHCCDDAAVALCGDALGYARALARMEGLRGTGAPLAVGAAPGSLLERVRRLASHPEDRLPPAARLPGAAVAVAAALALGLVALASWAARSERPSRPGAPGARAASPGRAVAPSPQAPHASSAGGPAPTAESRPGKAAPSPAKAAGVFDDAALSPEAFENLRAHGVTRAWAEDLAGAGLDGLTPNQLVQLRSHGVEGDFVRGFTALGYGPLSAGELVDLRDHGVTPAFAEEMGRFSERPSLSRLVLMRSMGVTAEYVSELQAEGYPHLSSVRLTALRSHGITLDYIRSLKGLGYDRLSVSRLIALRSHGVTPGFVSALSDLGYDHLGVGLLVALRDHGVTPEFVRGVEALGFEGLSAGGLIDLRAHGFHPPETSGGDARPQGRQHGAAQ